MMKITIDTSAVLAVCLNEPSKAALVSLSKGASLVAPNSIHWAIGNALSALLKRDRIDLKETKACLASYREIPIKLVDVDLYQALEIVLKYRIYAYDAFLLLCAVQHHTPLMTLDEPLKAVARQLGVVVLGDD
jgi:predicted nucleic acid-binding protein